ncbi:MAG: RICIN domain-containing protein [Firmicutes bacterium]|nr:RICIN domain-containing protein [Bacillota bacterium]
MKKFLCDKVCILLVILLLITMQMPVYAVNSEYNTEEASNMIFDEDYLQINDIPDQLKTLVFNDSIAKLDYSNALDLNMLSFENNNGSKTSYIFKYPVKFVDKNDHNKVKFIDNSFKKSNKWQKLFTTFEFENVQNDKKIYLPKKIKDGILFNDDDFSLQLIPIVKKNSKAQNKTFLFAGAKQDVVEYSDAFAKGYHLQYAAMYNGFKENILIDQYDGIYKFSFKMMIPGYYAVLGDRGVCVKIYKNGTSIDDSPQYIMNQPYAQDSYIGSPDGYDHFAFDNRYELEYLSDGVYSITMIIDESFLSDIRTVYPVMIDPTTAFASSGSLEDTYVCQNDSQNHSEESVLRIGNDTDNGDMALYIRNNFIWYFRYIRPENVTEAKYCTERMGGTASTMMVSVYDSTSSSIDLDSVNYQELSNKTGQLQSNFLWNPSSNNWHLDVTELTKKWLQYNLAEGGKSAQYGFIVKAADDSEGYINLRAADNCSEQNPYFCITYSEDTSVDTGTYYIKNKSSGSYLTTEGDAVADVSGSTLDGNSRQTWYIYNAGNGLYTLMPSVNSMYLQVKNGQNIQYQAVEVNVQAPNVNYPYYTWWRIIKNKNGSYRLIPYISSIYALSERNSSGQIEITDYCRAPGQSWLIEHVPSGGNIECESVIAGSLTQLSATVLPEDAPANVSWRIADGQGMMASITSDGILFAKAVGSVDVIAETINGVTISKTITIKPIIDIPADKPFQSTYGYDGMNSEWSIEHREEWYYNRIETWEYTDRNEVVFTFNTVEIQAALLELRTITDIGNVEQYKSSYWVQYRDTFQLMFDSVFGSVPVLGEIYGFIKTYSDLVNIRNKSELEVLEAFMSYIGLLTRNLRDEYQFDDLNDITLEVRMLYDAMGKREICVVFGDAVSNPVTPANEFKMVFEDLGGHPQKNEVYEIIFGVMSKHAYRITTYRVFTNVTYVFPGW